MMPYTKLWGSLLVALLVGACGHTAVEQKVDGAYRRTSEDIKFNKDIVKHNERQQPLVQKNNTPWLGSRSVTANLDEPLPASFNSITLNFPGRHSVSTVAERITRVTGLPVQVRPDVFLSARSLAAGLSTGTTPGQQGAGGGGVTPLSLPNTPAATGLSVSQVSDFAQDFELNYNGTLKGLLDLISSRLGVNWEYKNGQVEIYRLVTKSFTVTANPGNADYTTSMGKSGGGTASVSASGGAGGGSAGGGGSGFTSTSTVQMQARFSVWESIESAIKTVLSPLGKVSVSQATGTVTVTDTKYIVDQVSKIIENENRMLNRQVAIKVEILSVSMNDGAQTAIDWSLVYNKLAAATSLWRATFASPLSLAGAAAGSMGISILAPVTDGNNLTERVSGSSAMLAALSTFGKVSVVTTASGITLNRQPVPIALTNQVSYLASTTAATATAGGTGGTPGLNPGTITTGFLLNLLPTATDRNTILLQFSVDSSELLRLNTVTSGSGAQQQSIQTPEISGMQFLQRVGLKSGETLVITGFERDSNQYDRRTNAPGTLLFGGSSSGNIKKESLIILITPSVIEGV